MNRAIVSPGAQSATFVELFFDLVFVFCLTQIVGLLHRDLSWVGVGRALVVFWLVWWAWTQFTWALNAADTTHPFVELATLVATAVAFFMAVSIPESFSAHGAPWFAVPYVLVRLLGLWIYGRVARSSPQLGAAVRRFGMASVGGMVAVLVGSVLGSALQPWVWTLAIVLDVVAAMIGGSVGRWELHADHFAERHGLIVIIALGESLIVAAAGLTGTEFTASVVGVALLGVLVSCALWWTYFPIVKPELEEALDSVAPESQGAMARDVFSLAHFPMLCGVIAYAVALEEAIAHPADPLPPEGRLGLALGLFLFVGGTALAMWRATRDRPVARGVIVTLTAAVVFFASLPASAALGVAVGGTALIAFLDERRAQRLRA